MGYEIDFLAVGDGERGGDAIALRFGNLHGTRQEQFVMIIDGGSKESGQKLVEFVQTFYETSDVDLVVSSHPDNDHVSGLTVVLENLEVGRLWMHRPWEHAADFRDLFKNKTLTTIGLERSLRKALDSAYELEQLADEMGVPIDEPFSDIGLPFSNLGIYVLGPSTSYYEQLLPGFRETPEAKAEAKPSLLSASLTYAKEAALKWLDEKWGIETLTDPDENATSAENNSSVILLVVVGEKSLLFTGDAGVPALADAVATATSAGFTWPSLSFMQAPHHGSKHNLGPTILNTLLGPKLTEPLSDRTVFVSAPVKGDPKHPSRRVTNALQRRGAHGRVYVTAGQNKWHRDNAPVRSTYIDAVPVEFHTRVEE